MNTNKYIKMLMINLSRKYSISLIEITTVKRKKIKKSYSFNYKLKKGKTINKKETFYNKRDLLRWLSCLE